MRLQSYAHDVMIRVNIAPPPPNTHTYTPVCEPAALTRTPAPPTTPSHTPPPDGVDLIESPALAGAGRRAALALHGLRRMRGAGECASARVRSLCLHISVM